MIHEVRLGKTATLHISETLTGADWWLVFLPGSSAQFWEVDESELKQLCGRLPERPNFLLINKPGVSPSGRVNERVFERCFRRELRIRHYLTVLRRRIPRNHRILLTAFSEGAYLAPEIAARDRRIKAMALISGGTRSWLDEEIFKARSPQGMGKAIQHIGKVYARPRSRSLQWHGISNATWSSYDTDRTKEALRRLTLPVLSVFGSEDRMVDIDSALKDLRVLDGHVKTKVLKGVDHTLGNQWLRALRLSGEFFKEVLEEVEQS